MTDIVALIKGRLNDGRRISDADALAAAEEIDRLRGLLRERYDDEHTDDCWSASLHGSDCICGHDAVAAYFREIEG